MQNSQEAAIVLGPRANAWAKLRLTLSGVHRQVRALRASAEYDQIDARLIDDAGLDRNSYCGRPRHPWW